MDSFKAPGPLESSKPSGQSWPFDAGGPRRNGNPVVAVWKARSGYFLNVIFRLPEISLGYPKWVPEKGFPQL